jgi:stage III sporulation protein AG
MKWLSDKRVGKAAFIIGIAAILLIGILSVVDSSGKDRISTEAYAARTEKQLLEIVSQISGVGEVKIFLTMDNSGENVYLKNTDTKTVSIEPKVRGVVVVCDGGDDPTVVSHVLDAVTKALNIGSDKVCITK